MRRPTAAKLRRQGNLAQLQPLTIDRDLEQGQLGRCDRGGPSGRLATVLATEGDLCARGPAVAGGPLVRPRLYPFPSRRRLHVRVVVALDIAINFIHQISVSMYVLIFWSALSKSHVE